MSKLPTPSDAARAMQLAGAAAIKGTAAARRRASIAGKSITPKAARARALKAWATKRATAKRKVSTSVSKPPAPLQKPSPQQQPKGKKSL